MSVPFIDPHPMPSRSALLETLPGITHVLTGRAAGMGRANGNIGYSAPRDRADAWEMRRRWCAAAGLDARNLVTLGQVHGAEVHVAQAGHAGWGATPGSAQLGLGDALVTAEAGPVLMTLHADCQPIVLVDPARPRRGPVVAVIHAGWRGTVADVVGQTVAVLAAEFGSRPADLHAYLGPAIGPCCYEVGSEVAQRWAERAGSDAGSALVTRGDRFTFSLREANGVLLQRAGVQFQHIDASPLCTRCDGDRWFSHRGQGPDTGRFGALIGIVGVGGAR